MTLQLSGQAAVYWHLEAALKDILKELRRYNCQAGCNADTFDSLCPVCLISHIAATTLLGGDWREPSPSQESSLNND